jgi:hypothetical protein
MKRDSTIGKWLENNFDVNLRAAGNTYMQVWNAKFDQLLQKVKEYRSWGRKPRDVRTLVECVNDDVNWLMCREKEHFVKTARQELNAGLLGALPVCRINMGNYITTRGQVGRKLNEKRGEKFAETSVFFVSKVEEEIRQGGVFGIAQRYGVFYDHRALVNVSSWPWGCYGTDEP